MTDFEKFVAETMASKGDGDGPTAQEAWDYQQERIEAIRASGDARVAVVVEECIYRMTRRAYDYFSEKFLRSIAE